jgi:hypothetical protein
MKGIYSGNEDWLTRQRWIPIVLVAVAVIGGWAVGSRHQQGVADKHSEAQHVQPTAVKPQAPKQAAPEPMAAAASVPAPAGKAKIETISAVQSQPTTATAALSATETDKGGKSLGGAANRTKQRKACLELAKDNPSIICK